MARTLSSRRVRRAATRNHGARVKREPLSAKTSSHAVNSICPVKSSSTITPNGLPSFLVNFFSTEQTMPASRTVEGSSICCAADDGGDLRTVEMARISLQRMAGKVKAEQLPLVGQHFVARPRLDCRPRELLGRRMPCQFVRTRPPARSPDRADGPAAEDIALIQIRKKLRAGLPEASKAPHLTRLSKIFRFTLWASRRAQKSSRDWKDPDLSRSSITRPHRAAPTFLIEASPKRMAIP